MKLKIVSFETAKKLKEVGFDISCTSYYETWRNDLKACHKDNEKDALHNYEIIDQDPYSRSGDYQLEWFTNYNNQRIIAPTQALVQMWLKERHNLFILIQVGGFVEGKQTFYCNVFKFGKNLYRSYFRSKTSIYTYEQALEQGILEAIKLIKTD